MTDGELDQAGIFWLPRDPENKVPGVLTFNQTDGGSLRLIGTLGDEHQGLDSHPYSILGEIPDKAVTLEGCFQRTLRRASINTQTIHVNHAYVGAWFQPDHEPASFSEMFFGLEDLTAWVGKSGLRVETEWLGHGLARSIQADDLPAVEREAGEVLVRLWHRAGCEQKPYRSTSVTERHRLTLSARPEGSTLPAKRLLQLASDIQDLATAAFNRPVPFQDVCFHHPDVSRELAGKTRPLQIDFYARWQPTPQVATKAPERFGFTFTYEDIGGFEGLLAWLRLAQEHRQAIGRVMATREQGSMYSEDRFLNVVAAAEGFHRKDSGQEKRCLAGRLESLLSLAGDRFTHALSHHERWVRHMVKERDGVAHHRDRRLAMEDPIHFHLTQSAYWLMLLCFLTRMGAPEAALDAVASHRTFKWEMEQANELVGALDPLRV